MSSEARGMRLGKMGVVIFALPLTRLAIGTPLALTLAAIAAVFAGQRIPVGRSGLAAHRSAR